MGEASALFEDVFLIEERDREGRHFDKVSRYVCKSDLYGAELQLDVNCDIYPLELGARYKVLLTHSLVRDTGTEKDVFDPDLVNGRRPSLLDEYEYAMHGKVYRLDAAAGGSSGGRGGGGRRGAVYVSFGGLLMLLHADPQKLALFQMDAMVYLLMRKTL